MPRLIAFLRAINVGGHNVKMETLGALFVELGFTDVETFIASGNVIFTTNRLDIGTLEQRIADHLQASLGYAVATFLRTDAEVQAVANYQPFAAEEMQAALALNVGFLAEPLSREASEKVLTYRNAMDDLHLQGREIYWLCRMRQTESPFAKAGFEKIVKVKATFRGLNTVRKLAAKYPTS
ncbi:MAG: DUF1697 domain-containing protein [Blastocatellia bacterium]